MPYFVITTTRLKVDCIAKERMRKSSKFTSQKIGACVIKAQIIIMGTFLSFLDPPWWFNKVYLTAQHPEWWKIIIYLTVKLAQARHLPECGPLKNQTTAINLKHICNFLKYKAWKCNCSVFPSFYFLLITWGRSTTNLIRNLPETRATYQ